MSTLLSERIADAYAIGFCKAAEELGESPDTLYKLAAGGRMSAVVSGGKRILQLLAGGDKRIGQLAAKAGRVSAGRTAKMNELLGRNSTLLSHMDDISRAISRYSAEYGSAIDRVARAGRLAGQAGNAASKAREAQMFLLSQSGKLGGRITELERGPLLSRIKNLLPFSEYSKLKSQVGALDRAAERANKLYRSSVQHGNSLNALGDAAIADARRISGLKEKATNNLNILSQRRAAVQGELPGVQDLARSGSRRADMLNRAVNIERNKVLATRLGVGGTAVGGIGYALSGSGADKEAEAYAPGFCKAAEAMGVDPAELYKQAGLEQLLGRGRQALGALAGKLHIGSAASKAVAPKATSMADKLRNLGSAAADVGIAAKDSASSVLKRYVELLRGGNRLSTMPYTGVDKLLSAYHKAEKALGEGNAISRGLRHVKLYGGALRGDLGNGTATELRKVLTARAGTAAGAVGIGAGGAAIAGND